MKHNGKRVKIDIIGYNNDKKIVRTQYSKISSVKNSFRGYALDEFNLNVNLESSKDIKDLIELLNMLIINITSHEKK